MARTKARTAAKTATEPGRAKTTSRTKALGRAKAPRATTPRATTTSRTKAPSRATTPRATTTSRTTTPRATTPRATTDGASGGSPMFEKIAFTMFSVEDPTRARAFYEGVLGLTRGLASPEGSWTEYDLPGGGCLALFRHPNPAFARPPGGASVALEVADLDALNTRLVAAGVRYQGDIVHGPHCRMSNILDSEGNSLILHELATKH